MTDTPLFDEYNEPKKGKYASDNLIGNKETVYRTISGSPESVVKIVSAAHNTAALNSMVDYQARLDSKSVKQGRDPVMLEDEQGNLFTGREARRDALMTWQGIKDQGRREAFHIVCAMPVGVPHGEVHTAARQFAQAEFKGFQYVIARHDDTDHPHVHLIVHATPYAGTKRLAPTPDDLNRWREVFAENLRELGVEANATRRIARLVMDYPRSSGSLNREKRLSPKAEIENRRKANYVNIDELQGRIKQVYTEYVAMAQELARGDEKDREGARMITGWLDAQRDRSRDKTNDLER